MQTSSLSDSSSICDRLISNLSDMGIYPGDTLLVHTSLKGLHTPGLAPEIIIEALLELLGKEGTLFVPALSYANVTPDHPVFQINETPACIGALPECFRTKYAQCRSLHPTHSVCAAGRLAKKLTDRHALDDTPVGQFSPFRLLPEYHGKILMLGCGLRPNTFMHGVEEYAGAPYPLARKRISYTLTLEDGRQVMKEYYPHNFGSLEQRYDRLESLLSPGELQSGPVLGGTAFLLDAAAALTKGAQKIKADPCYFVSGKKNGKL